MKKLCRQNPRWLPKRDTCKGFDKIQLIFSARVMHKPTGRSPEPRRMH